MSSLESRIDSLYQEPLDSFVAARTALAKTLSGDEARRVKQLKKPTATAWAVNQVYWQSKPLYDRLVKSGKKLRAAQIAALNGRSPDVRGASDEHRTVVSEAVAEASKLASGAGAHPNTDDISRTFEALSLQATPSEAPGRLTTSLQPLGFEALAGIVVSEPAHRRAHAPQAVAPQPSKEIGKDENSKRSAEAMRARQREEAAAQRQREAAIEKAAAVVARAKAAEAQARSEWERCQREYEHAEQALARLRSAAS